MTSSIGGTGRGTAGGPARRSRRVRTPTILQMEAVECGAAALAIVLAYYKSYVPLEELRIECGVSRDGSKASNVLKAARKYGLAAKGYRKEPAALQGMKLPLIIHWNFNHFLVLEGFSKDKAYLNDPAAGPRTVTLEEFDQSFTGVVLALEPSPEYQRRGRAPNMAASVASRLKGSRLALAFVVIAGLFLVLPGLVIPTFTRIFIDDILLAGLSGWLTPLLLGMGATAIVRLLLTWLQRYYLLKLEMKFSLSASSRFFWHVLRLPIEFFSQRYGGEIASRVMINDRVAQLLSGDLAVALLNCILLLFYFVLMLQYSLLLTLVVVCASLFNIAFLRYVSRKREDQNQKLLQDGGKLEGVSMNGLQLIETLKSNSSEADFFAKWSGYQSKVMNAMQQFGVSNQWLSALPVLLTGMSSVAILGLGGLKVMDGDLTIGMLVAFQSLAVSFSEPVNQLMQLGGSLQEAKGGLKRLDDVLEYPLDTNVLGVLGDPEGAGERSAPGNRLSGRVELRDIEFGYSKLEEPLIRNFSLTLRPGARVALVGGSGSGKSTIAKLVAGIYQPWSGEVLFDQRPRSDIPREEIGHSMAIVDQEIMLFEGTIRDNLTFWDASIPETDMIRAAKDAAIHDAITERSGGYDYRIEENGGNFSGGQRQRLEIARALAGNPSILVLDEATSALDPLTEKQVDESLRRRGVTCLIVAHRLSTIRDADEIIVMQRGRIAERGTHKQLLDIGGIYASLIQEQ